MRKETFYIVALNGEDYLTDAVASLESEWWTGNSWSGSEESAYLYQNPLEAVEARMSNEESLDGKNPQLHAVVIHRTENPEGVIKRERFIE